MSEALAGLARVSLAQGGPAQALAHVGRILDHLGSRPELQGMQEPVRIYLTCYRVLQAAGDARAQPVLEGGYWLLQERANRVETIAKMHADARHRTAVALFRASLHLALHRKT